MLRKATTEEITAEEIAAQEIESRVKLAESQFLIIVEDKKRLEREISSLYEVIAINKEIVNKNNTQIFSLKSEILDLQNSVSKEKENLEVVKTSNAAELKSIEEEKTKRLSEKADIEFSISNLSKTHDKDTSVRNSEIKILESKKISLTNDSIELFKRNGEIVEQILSNETKLNQIELDVTEKIDENVFLEEKLSSIKGLVGDEETTLAKKRLEISSCDGSILSKNNEINTLQIKIDTKNAELKASEQKAFALISRSDLLNQKEAFIKSQYERAGIKWEE